MSSLLPRRTDLGPGLVRDSVRAARTSALAWAVGGGLFMYGMAVALAAEMEEFPGGPQALGDSIAASAEAMRVFRWPAERLDTLGGYLTYHNVVLVNLFLAIYGAVLGVRAIRGGEERHAVEELLATGLSRRRLVRARTLGFTVTALLVATGLTLGTAVGLAVGDQPDLVGAVVTCGTSGLVAVTGFALGLAVSQLVSSARAAAGATSATLLTLYVVTNLGEELGPVSVLRFASPFHYANESRAMVPGHGLDPVATVVLVGLAAALLALGTAAFERRDYASALWPRASARPAAAGPPRLPSALLGAVWTASLRRGAVGLLAWALGAAGMGAMFVFIQPSVMDAWAELADFMAIAGGGPGVTVEDTYWSLAGDMVAPVVAAYVVVTASGWVGDLAQGRVEMTLAGPVSWTRLVVGRWLAVIVGTAVITAATLGTLVLGGWAVGGSVDPVAMLRTTVMSLLLGAALGAVAAVVVSWVRRPAAVTVLALVVAASYVLTLFVALLDWPSWLNRTSVFWAFGHPYLQWPPASALLVLLVLASAGTWLATRVAERSPKVA